MAAESNVGLRILVIGKDAGIAAMRELTSAAAKMNEEIAAGGKASKVAAAGYAEQGAGLEALSVKMDLYQKNLAAVGAETDAVAKLGKVAFLGLAAAATAWTYESVKWATSYQTALVQLRTQAGLTVTAMNAIGAAAMRNSANLGVSPTAYLQAAYHPASTGMSTAETIAITNYAAKEAAISGAPLGDTTNSLTGVMKSYGLGAGQTASTIAKLNAIVGAGNMHFSDLNSALASGVASTAKTFGVSLTSLGGAIAYMTDRGVPAAQAGTRLRMAISLLGAPSKEASTLLQDAGMTSSAAADSTNAMSQTLYAAGVQPTELSAALANNSGKGGIYNALALLRKNLAGSGMSKEMQDALISRSFGGGRMGTSIEAMYNNIPGLGQKSTQIERGGTTSKFNQDWIESTKTLRFELHKLGAEVETLGTQFGLAIIPPLTKAVTLFSDLLGWLDKNKGVAIALGTAITAVLAPAIGVYLYRSLLSSGGAIKTVIRGYAQLMGSQSAEDLALARTDAALGGNDASLAVNDRALLTNSAERTGSSGLGGLGTAGGMGSKLLKGAMWAGAGLTAGSMIRGSNGAMMTSNQTTGQKLRSFFGDTAEGALMGSMFGPEGTVIGGVGGALYSEAKPIESGAKGIWDDLFGGGQHAQPTSASSRPITIHNEVTVMLDGKKVTKGVTKQTKATAARS